MTPEQTAATYNQIDQHWDCPEFNSAYGINQHKRALQFVSECENALDIGCGSSGRIISLLLSRGFTVEGLDLSQEMLKRAQRHHPSVQFHMANICSWEFPKNYDFISAWDSIWHIPLCYQLEVLRKICGGLTPRRGVNLHNWRCRKSGRNHKLLFRSSAVSRCTGDSSDIAYS